MDWYCNERSSLFAIGYRRRNKLARARQHVKGLPDPQGKPQPLLSERPPRASPCPVSSHRIPTTTLQVGDGHFHFPGKSPGWLAPYPSSPSLWLAEPLFQSPTAYLSVCQGHILPLFPTTSPRQEPSRSGEAQRCHRASRESWGD